MGSKNSLNFIYYRFIIVKEVKVREITLRIKNDQLAENIVDLIKKIKGIEIFETKKREISRKKSKIFQILDNPYDMENFKITKREEIYERPGIF